MNFATCLSFSADANVLDFFLLAYFHFIPYVALLHLSSNLLHDYLNPLITARFTL
jgi:hypothetical protein